MSVSYRIYSNGGMGGPVDYSAPLATVSTLSYTVGQLRPSSDYTFLVHSVDTVSLLEEANSEARVRIVTDAQGNDVSSTPSPVQSASVSPSLGGGARVAWSYIPNRPSNRPSGFSVELISGGDVVATASVPVANGSIGYTHDFAGPLSSALYTATVKAVGSNGLISGPFVVTSRLGLSPDPFVMDSLIIQ